MLKTIGKQILTGLITLLPVILTVYVLYWFAVSTEDWLGNLIRHVVPNHWYWPGMGLVAGLLLAFAVGLLMHAYVVRQLFSLTEQLFYRVPLIKSIYGSLRDFLDYFSPQAKREFEQVVSISIGETGMELIGFVTQANPEKMPDDFGGSDRLIVYIPLSYMIGGYTVLVPRDRVRPLDMSMEEAMRFVLTAGVTGGVQNHRHPSAGHR